MDATTVVWVILQVLSLAVAGVALYCFVRVVLAMRDNGERVLAMFCVVTVFLMGAGSVVAFIYGIVKSRDWDIAPTMMLWGTCTALNLMLLGALLALPS